MKKKIKINVVAALISKDGRFLLCQRKDCDRFGGLWEFPGGKVEKGESFERAIEREIKEELTLTVEAKEVVQKFNDEEIEVYLLSSSIKEGSPLAKECKDWGFFSLEEIKYLNLAPADKKIYNYLLKSSSLFSPK